MKHHDTSHKTKFFRLNLFEIYTKSELFENDNEYREKNKRIKSKYHFNPKIILFFFVTLYFIILIYTEDNLLSNNTSIIF